MLVNLGPEFFIGRLPVKDEDSRDFKLGESHPRKRTNLSDVIYKWPKVKYSGDLNSKLVKYSDGSKQFVPRMVRNSSHVLNIELIVTRPLCLVKSHTLDAATR